MNLGAFKFSISTKKLFYNYVKIKNSRIPGLGP